MMDSNTHTRIRSAVCQYSDRMMQQLYDVCNLYYIVNHKKKQIGELDNQIYQKEMYIYELGRNHKANIELNEKMCNAMISLRQHIQRTWEHLEKVEEMIQVKSNTVAQLDEEISRKRKRVEEIDQFVSDVLV